MAADDEAFKYVCPECDNEYEKAEEKFSWQEGGRERDRCVYCNRFKKRLSDSLKKLPEDAKKAWRALSALQKKEYRQGRLDVAFADMPATMTSYLEKVGALLRIFASGYSYV